MWLCQDSSICQKKFENFDDVTTYLVLSKNILSMSKQFVRIFFLTWMKYIEECFILIMLICSRNNNHVEEVMPFFFLMI